MENSEERPFIIWTFRRTGGTSLRRLLYWLSGLEYWQDEAFNDDRELGAITSSFLQSKNLVQLEEAVEKAVSVRKNLKHCIEVVPYEVSSALLRRSVAHGYRHVILLRANEVDRQVSLEVARCSGAWAVEEAGPIFAKVKAGEQELPPLNLDAIAKQLEMDAIALGRVLRKFHEGQIPHTVVFFEDLYSGPLEERAAKLRVLCATIGLSRAHREKDEAFRGSLMDRDQGTKDIFPFIPNLNEARKMIEAYTL